jgi:hypothetical protein
VPTQVILASGDPIATDVVALGLIKAFGRWDLVTAKGVWEQVQIRRAMALGLGARGPHEIEFLTADLTGAIVPSPRWSSTFAVMLALFMYNMDTGLSASMGRFIACAIWRMSGK